jgi:hypothetical protein
MNELKSEPDAEGLAFELNDLLVGAYWARLAGFPTPLGPVLQNVFYSREKEAALGAQLTLRTRASGLTAESGGRTPT